jgi:hypothetical protein
MAAKRFISAQGQSRGSQGPAALFNFTRLVSKRVLTVLLLAVAADSCPRGSVAVWTANLNTPSPPLDQCGIFASSCLEARGSGCRRLLLPAWRIGLPAASLVFRSKLQTGAASNFFLPGPCPCLLSCFAYCPVAADIGFQLLRFQLGPLQVTSLDVFTTWPGQEHSSQLGLSF